MAEQNFLSGREKEVVNLLLQGKSNKQIALTLAISQSTVEFHLKNIYIKLAVRSRTEAILKLGKSTGVIYNDKLGESAVAGPGEPAENEGMPNSRKIPKKRLFFIVGGVLLGVTVLLLAFVLVLGPVKGVKFQSIEAANTSLTPLTMDSASETIRQKMQNSTTYWQTIYVDGTVTWYTPDGRSAAQQVIHEQDWIDLTNHRFRVLLGPAGAAAETFRACDGATILEIDLKSGQSQSNPLPKFAQDSSSYPGQDMLWGQIGTPLTEIVLSANYAASTASSGGVFRPLRLEPIAGRQALVADWTRSGNSQHSFRAWVDVETGVILKFQEFGKTGSETLQGERVVNQVTYNADLNNALFAAPASPPQYSDITGNPLTPAAPAPPPSTQADSLGQVYFFIFDHNYGNEKTNLVRLPGSCVTGQSACPKPEIILTPVPLNFSLTPLVWSPDGSAAAYAYPINVNGNRTGLFLFDPLKQTWTSLAEFNFIDPPMWSQSGNWLAFRVQDGQGGEDIYAIRREGTGLINLTAFGKLPSDGRPYVIDGWLGNSVILHSNQSGTEGKVYLLNPADGTLKPLFETLLLKSVFVPSPDGSHLAYVEYSNDNTKRILKSIDTEGTTVHELGVFQGGSIFPIVWSPDGTKLGFVYFADPQQPDQDVYVINRDGTGFSQVYHGMLVGSLAFSPDGKSLLIQADTAAGRHIFVINLMTMDQHILQAPDLPLDWWWLAPSWRP